MKNKINKIFPWQNKSTFQKSHIKDKAYFYEMNAPKWSMREYEQFADQAPQPDVGEAYEHVLI